MRWLAAESDRRTRLPCAATPTLPYIADEGNLSRHILTFGAKGRSHANEGSPSIDQPAFCRSQGGGSCATNLMRRRRTVGRTAGWRGRGGVSLQTPQSTKKQRNKKHPTTRWCAVTKKPKHTREGENHDRANDMSPRPTDYCWEALVEETAAIPEAERAVLNRALKIIRIVCAREGIHPDSIPQEIHLRADAYRRTFAHCSLTPMALAKHWNRVMVKQPMSSEEATFAALRSTSHGSVQL